MSELDLVIRAAAFAAHKHRHQRRKDADATPYINHPLALARIGARLRAAGLTERGMLGCLRLCSWLYS